MRIQYIQEKDHMFTGASLSNWYLLMTCLFEFIKLQDPENTACQSKSRTERKPKKKSIAFQRSQWKPFETDLTKSRISTFNNQYPNITYAGSSSYITNQPNIITHASRSGLSHQHNDHHKSWHTPPWPADHQDEQLVQDQQSNSSRLTKPPDGHFRWSLPPRGATCTSAHNQLNFKDICKTQTRYT